VERESARAREESGARSGGRIARRAAPPGRETKSVGEYGWGGISRRKSGERYDRESARATEDGEGRAREERGRQPLDRRTP